MEIDKMIMKNLLPGWTGPLPPQELFPDRKYNPFVHWIYHPLIRHLARNYVKILQKYYGLTVIGITGSYGKTTTKDMLYAILKNSAPTVASIANITSTYNIPRTILRCTPNTKYLILEMGVEYPGDMDFYNWLVHPDIAVITSISPVHLEFMGNLKNIRTEKFKITRFAKHIVTFENTKVIHFDLPILGNQFDLNASLAAKVANLLKLPINFAGFIPPPHRMKLMKLKNNNFLIDDSYNANPEAVKASLQTLMDFCHKKKLIPAFAFGQMNELGRQEKSSHEAIGKLVKKLNIKHFFCVGPATLHSIKSAGFGQQFNDPKALLQFLTQFCNLHSAICILVKGSRSWHLETIASSLS